LSPRNVKQIAFAAKWDPARRQYVALDDNGGLLGMSRLKGLAMGIARSAAVNAAKERGVKITVMVEDDSGTFRKQWTFAPPSKTQRRDW